MTTIIIITPPVKHTAEAPEPEDYAVQVVGDGDVDVMAVLTASLNKYQTLGSGDATSD